LVDSLPEEHGMIIKARYREGRTLENIGEQFGHDTGWVRIREYKALRELRMPSRSRKLKPFIDEFTI